MDLLRRSDLDRLLVNSSAPTVSVFAPTFRVGKETQQNPVRLRKLLDEAEARLKASGMDCAAARAVLQPGRDLLIDGDFWRHQAEGLALFMAPGYAESFRLPVEVPELVVTGTRFHVRPLVPALWPDQPFYVLALSQGGVRLLRGSRYSVERVELEQVPDGMGEVMRYIDAEKQRQFHVSERHGGSRVGPTRGHAEGRDAEDTRVAEYLRRVAYGVGKTLNSNGAAPLVLAAVDYVQAVYREVASFPPVFEKGLSGNPERLSDEELRARAWALVEPLARRRMADDAQRYLSAAGRGEAPQGVAATLLAALEGRVDALFVCREEVAWGRFDAATGEAELRESCGPGDEDLLDRAAALTMMAGGTVYCVPRQEMPGPGPLAAVPRF